MRQLFKTKKALMAVCWEYSDGCIHISDSFSNPQDFILACGRGAYTTVMLKDGQLVDWDLHLERLKRFYECTKACLHQIVHN